jgi:hypothetical protein
MYRRRKLGLTDELLPRPRQVDEDKAGGARASRGFSSPTIPHIFARSSAAACSWSPSDMLNR